MKIFLCKRKSYKPQVTENFEKLKNYRNVWDKIDFFIANDLNDYIGEVNE